MDSPTDQNGVDFFDTGEDGMLDQVIPFLDQLVQQWQDRQAQEAAKQPQDSVRAMRMAGLRAKRS